MNDRQAARELLKVAKELTGMFGTQQTIEEIDPTLVVLKIREVAAIQTASVGQVGASIQKIAESQANALERATGVKWVTVGASFVESVQNYKVIVVNGLRSAGPFEDMEALKKLLKRAGYR